MNVLVTGGGGFLGSHLVERMRAEGLDVAFFHEADGPSDRARIDIGDVPLFSAVSGAVGIATSHGPVGIRDPVRCLEAKIGIDVATWDSTSGNRRAAHA